MMDDTSRNVWDHPDIQDYVNSLLENADDSFDDDEAAPTIAVRYVRSLESNQRTGSRVDAPVFYCIAHEGIANEDMRRCDLWDAYHDITPCDFRQLYYDPDSPAVDR